LSTIAILQARMSSSRLPGKVLRPILGKPMLARQIERIGRAKSLDKIVVATSTALEDDAIPALCDDLDVACFRGSLDDVLDRVNACAEAFGTSHVVRLTGDCPLTDPDVIDLVVNAHLDGMADYTSNVHPPTWPDGLDVEVIRRDVLTAAAAEALLPSEREHVTPFITARADRFTLVNVHTAPDRSAVRLTVDEPQDLKLIAEIFAALSPSQPDFGIDAVLDLLERRPELLSINAGIDRNEGMKRSHRQDADFLPEGIAKDAP
jgi:spore coat polysaccharide biosynthesis protein SpsF